MQIFLDSADIKEIKEMNKLGIIDGVTTNPSLMSKTQNYSLLSTIYDICKAVGESSDVSVQVIAEDFENMKNQGDEILNNELLKEFSNIVVKFPMTWEGIKACRYFANKGKKVNMTLCFSVNQAIIAAKAGAYYISPFIGRLDDIGQSGVTLVNEIKQVYSNYSFKTKILAASIRSLEHVSQVALAGADVVTIPSKIIQKLLDHQLTSDGLEIFKKDWEHSQLKI